jgi:hypothetical protein
MAHKRILRLISIATRLFRRQGEDYLEIKRCGLVHRGSTWHYPQQKYDIQQILKEGGGGAIVGEESAKSILEWLVLTL